MAIIASGQVDRFVRRLSFDRRLFLASATSGAANSAAFARRGLVRLFPSP
jgi:hypothetical protein